MDQLLEPGGLKKIESLRSIVAMLRTDLSCPQVAFPIWHDDDSCEDAGFVEVTLPDADGGTPLGPAIAWCKAQGATHLVVVSDGAPDSEPRALQAAKAFGGKIDVIYVGPPGSRGEHFLKELAAMTGGSAETISLREPKQLTSQLRGLLSAPTVSRP
jgi:hypothetical protein